jgi:uncharacterized protein (DUF1800 family)
MVMPINRQSHRVRIDPLARTVALSALILSFVILALPHLAAAKDKKNKDKKNAAQEQSLKGLPATSLSEDEAIVHALNRLGYGPRPGDVDRVKQMGLAKWIDEQLHPESIDDSALSARLQLFPTLTMSDARLLDEFPEPRVAAQRAGLTLEEYRKGQQEKLQAIQQAMQAGAQLEEMSGPGHAPAAQGQAPSPVERDAAGPGETASGGNAKAGKASGLSANRLMDYQQIRAPQRIVAELAMAKMDRAIYSERQLYEQMVDFWFNHFNVFAGKGLDVWLLTSYERDAIRPHAMGKFRDLLEATAKSPAMLFYLDNWQSVDPQAWARLRQQQEERRSYLARFGRGPFGMPPFPAGSSVPNQAKNQQQERGLNEN